MLEKIENDLANKKPIEKNIKDGMIRLTKIKLILIRGIIHRCISREIQQVGIKKMVKAFQ
ncbi:MAG: hypothetical protein CL489_11665 [Acidobacteria bacterium]|nr:hypothetical protein [Acidobacteriota bacterium]